MRSARCQIHLLWIGPGEPPEWPLGNSIRAAADPRSIVDAGNRLMSLIAAREQTGLLLWSQPLGTPDAGRIQEAFSLPGELWHAGLLTGQGAGTTEEAADNTDRPQLLGFVHPTWMLLLDPPLDRPASSWKISSAVCLMRATVWQRFGGPPLGYDSIEGAFLDWGHRLLGEGVLCRHVPRLLPEHDFQVSPPDPLSVDDEVLFLRRRVGPRWAAWAVGRAWVSGMFGAQELHSAWRRAKSSQQELTPEALAPRRSEDRAREGERARVGVADAAEAEPRRWPKVSVLVPTLGRYDYLRVLIGQLAQQTVPPHEVLLIDQTAPDARQTDWAVDAGELNIRRLERDRPGQCSSRNAGLLAATGEVVLFLDDDDEIAPNLIEQHLSALELRKADAICGVAEEAGAGPLSAEFRRRRISDVFPTNNASLRRQALERSGLFDLAFETGARADLDLGFRLYLSGALLVLEPSISVFHHRAPSGGLRRHKARTTTYSDSRKRLLSFHLPSPTEIYLARRYFPPRLAREASLLRLAGTFAQRGPMWRRLAKIAVALVGLPRNLRSLSRSRAKASELGRRFPEIPALASGARGEAGDSDGAEGLEIDP